MKIEVVRAFWLDGKTRDAGDVFDVPDALGHELIGLRKAIGHVESEPKPARPQGQGRGGDCGRTRGCVMQEHLAGFFTDFGLACTAGGHNFTAILDAPYAEALA